MSVSANIDFLDSNICEGPISKFLLKEISNVTYNLECVTM